MIEALKSLLNLAATAQTEGHPDDAERLYKEAAEQARAEDTVARAEALMGTARLRRQNSDRTGASIYLSEAITLLRNEYATQPDAIAPTLARALCDAGEVRGELGESAVAGAQIEEAIRLFRALTPQPLLDIAHALRVSALNSEREARTAWQEAVLLFREASLQPREAEAESHLHALKQIRPDPQT